MKTLINTQMMTICCFYLILIGFKTSAQQSSVNPVELIETNIKVTAFAETDRFYWFGTENGGYQVKKKNGKVWHMKDNNSRLPSNKVTAICARSNGEVFIGTDKGILRYDRVTFVPVNTENAQLSSNDIRAIHCDKQDFVWIGTSENALSLIRYTTMHSFSKYLRNQ